MGQKEYQHQGIIDIIEKIIRSGVTKSYELKRPDCPPHSVFIVMGQLTGQVPGILSNANQA